MAAATGCGLPPASMLADLVTSTGLAGRLQALKRVAQLGAYLLDFAYTAVAVRVGCARSSVRWVPSGTNTMAERYGAALSWETFCAGVWLKFLEGDYRPLAWAVGWSVALATR